MACGVRGSLWPGWCCRSGRGWSLQYTPDQSPRYVNWYGGMVLLYSCNGLCLIKLFEKSGGHQINYQAIKKFKDGLKIKILLSQFHLSPRWPPFESLPVPPCASPPRQCACKPVAWVPQVCARNFSSSPYLCAKLDAEGLLSKVAGQRDERSGEVPPVLYKTSADALWLRGCL